MNRSNLNSDDFMSYIQNWWNKLGYMNKGLIILSCLIYSSTFFTAVIATYSLNIPIITIYKFQLWRLFTSCFLHINILQLLFSLMSLIPITDILEKEQGSVGLLLDFFKKATLIQILFSVIVLALGLIEVIEVNMIFSCGLWSLVMYYLTLRCAMYPEQ